MNLIISLNLFDVQNLKHKQKSMYEDRKKGLYDRLEL
jgi:hypothetical protein